MESTLINQINAISDSELDYKMDNDLFRFVLNSSKELEGLQLRFIIKKSGQEILSKVSEERTFSYRVNELNYYEFTVEFIVNGTVVRTTNLGNKLMGLAGFTFNGCQLEASGGQLGCSLEINTKQDLQYAFYVKKNGIVIEKIGYSRKKSFSTKLEGAGSYQVKFFIKWENDKRFSSSSETIEVSIGFYPTETKSVSIDENYLKGLWVKNNKRNLIIVFQSIGAMNKAMLADVVETKDYKKYREQHKKYSWWSLTTVVEADYLFIEDYFSGAYGWYMIDQGRCIIDELNEDLTNFLKDKNYQNVISFGSSKGGTGALLYGISNPFINHVVSLVPQIKAITYIQRTLKDYYSLFFPSKNEELESILNNYFLNRDNYVKEKCGKTNVTLYTGVHDTQFNEINHVSKILMNQVAKSNLLINTGKKKHTALVVDNKRLFVDLLEACIFDNEVKDSRIVTLRNDVHLFLED